MVASQASTIDTFWSGRKLLMAYQLLVQNLKGGIPLTQLIFPFRYPMTTTTLSWEAYRTFICLSHLKSIGITLKKVKVDPLFFALQKEDPEWLSDEPMTQFTPAKVNAIIGGAFADQIDGEGNGEFLLMTEPVPDSILNVLRAPGFFTCVIEVDKKKLKKALTHYIRAYRAGELYVRGKVSVFGHAFTNRLFDKFLKALTFRQGKALTFQFGMPSKRSAQPSDQFLNTFYKSFRYEYELWQSGQYYLPFFEHLISLTLQEDIALESCKAERMILDPTSGEEMILKWWAYHQIPMNGELWLRLLPPKPKPSFKFWQKKIEKIEVSATTQKQFFVYLNEEYKMPIVLTKATKSGKLWYSLAEDGFAEFVPFRRTYEYVNTDRRFKFFAQTKYTPSQLLDRDDDGYIIPGAGISISLRHE
ncbi:MAG: hypothetical protein AAF927_02255 [Bacteroidota bacterium]